MKKLITLLLVTVMVASMAFASVPVSAEEELHNYITDDMMKWSTEFMGEPKKIEKLEEDGETVYKATGITQQWCMPYLENVRPAFVEALGEDDAVELTITFKLRMEYTEAYKNKGTETRVMLAIRCKEDSGKAADLWNLDYRESMGFSQPLFARVNGVHTIWYPESKFIVVTDSEWTEYTLNITMDEMQINNEHTAFDWMFGFDRIHEKDGQTSVDASTFFKRFGSLYIKDLGIYKTDEYLEANATPTPEPTATPEPTPVPTQKPTDAPSTSTTAPAGTQATATAGTTVPTDDDNKSDNTIIIVAAVAAVVVAAAVVAVVIVLKKRSAAGKEEAAEEAAEETADEKTEE